VDEWRRAYINYRGLKKLIKRVQQYHDARLARQAQGHQDTGRMPLIRRATLQSFLTGSNANYGAIQEDNLEANEPLPTVDLRGTSLRLDDEGDVDEGPAAETRSMLGTRRAGSDEGDDSGNDSGLAISPFAADEESSSPAPPMPELSELSIDDLLKVLFDEEERKFYRVLDREVKRINKFYVEREHEAIRRISTLVNQLTELSEHRRIFKAAQDRRFHLEARHSFSGTATSWYNPHKQKSPAPSEHVTSSDEDVGDKRRHEAIEHLQVMNIHPDGTCTPSVSHDPFHYKEARQKLRAAVIENFRALEILRNYQILNRTGLNKILKKFDKTLNVKTLQKYFDARVVPTPLVESNTTVQMLEAVEEIFTIYFEHGDKKRAREQLRNGIALPSGVHQESHYGVVFCAGIYLGVALCCTVEGMRAVMDPAIRFSLPQWRSLLIVYAVEMIPTLFSLLFGLNLLGWSAVRINTVFIFEFDSGNALEPVQYFELPSFLLMLLGIFFCLSFTTSYKHIVAPTTWPLVWLVIVVIVIVNPMPVMHKSSRYWMLRTLVRVLTGGFVWPVEFRDFFIGDELNSVAYSVSNLWLLHCEYQTHWSPQIVCDGNATFWTPVLSSLPAFLRLTQCVRRYIDSHGIIIHLINACKYSSTIAHAFSYFLFRHHGSVRTQDFRLWVVCATINSVFTCSWDIYMDWDLLQPDAKYPLLRHHLAFEDDWWLYYFAMCTNVLLRFLWITYLLPGPMSTPMRAFVVGLLEMLRRWQWNFFRLENEHIGNADSFKIVRDLPLPYPVSTKVRGQDKDAKSLSFPFKFISHAPSNSAQKKNEQERRVRDSLQRTRQNLQQVRRRHTIDESEIQML